MNLNYGIIYYDSNSKKCIPDCYGNKLLKYGILYTIK